MTSIFFVGTYKPIQCGIADYTSFLTQESPDGKWGVLCFDPRTYGVSPAGNNGVKADPVWYGLPSFPELSASSIRQGLNTLGARRNQAVLWFQHETAIWSDTTRFVSMLSDLEVPKIVTFHTLHFQSTETQSGLREYHFNLLRDLLPHVDAITVFTGGVYQAATFAFPEYSHKIHLIEHGIHTFPELVQLSRPECKKRLHEFLVYESDLDQAAKESINERRLFLDPDAIIIGQTGFVCPNKQSEALFNIRGFLQKMLPHKRIVAVRIGSPRDDIQKAYASGLSYSQDGKDKFYLETLLPSNILPLAQRAFDINFYWPSECTQSGILAHAFGAGATVAGRDMEGVGETIKQAGGLVDTDLENLLIKIRDTILDTESSDTIMEKALDYATQLSWKKQALKHYELAEKISNPLYFPEAQYPWASVGSTPFSLSENTYEDRISVSSAEKFESLL